jgi:hypothetical protein
MDTIAVDGRIGVIEFTGCADACGGGFWSGEAIPALLVTR